jgi:LysR family cyn operon transcriptional activator
VEHRLLEYFIAVCEELHFTRAAEKLGISQPTLSHQIQLLEQRVGAPLFLRIGKKIFLSEAGHILLKHSTQVFYELKQAQLSIDELQGLKRGRLRIGCAGNHLLTSSLISFHQQYPGIELSVTELATDDTKEALLMNRLDLGVVFLPLEDDQLDNVPLFQEELQLAVSKAHELAKADSVRLQDLRNYPLIMLQQKFVVRQMLNQYCKEAGVELQISMELSTMDSLMQMAKSHVGAVVLPRSYLARMNHVQLRIVPIIDPVPQRSIGIVFRKNSSLHPSMHAFIQQLIRDFTVLG